MVAQVIIEAAQDLLTTRNENCFDTEAIEDSRELNGNVAAAHNHDAARQLLQMKCII